MQQIERRKAYKACDPYTTINNIRAILSSFDFFTIEGHVFYHDPGVNCCRVMSGDNDIVDIGIGTNGKGLTTRYALASAYGEFMERLQNGVLFPIRALKFATKRYLEMTPFMDGFKEHLEREELVLDFHHAPDEVYLNINTLVDECSDVLSKQLRISSASEQKEYLYSVFGDESVACVPYYSVFQKRVRLLPFDLVWYICGTNGMCSGNTPEEALLQGISEIFERFVIKSIYTEEIAPPTIPIEYFQDTEIYNHIRLLEKLQGITAIIKDCSLGRGLPVIGLLLIDWFNNKYAFHVGADACPITALERCLTEIYQGNTQEVKGKFHSLHTEKDPFGGINENSIDVGISKAYYLTVKSGSGIWPDSILSDTFSYQFNGFAHPISLSDASDLNYLVGKVSELGYDLFIRDVSFLGFPAYQVHIPGMCEVVDFIFEETKPEMRNWMEIARSHRTFLNLKQSDAERIGRLAQTISKTTGAALPTSFEPPKWFLSNAHRSLQKLSHDFLLVLLFSRIEDYRSAAEYMGRYLQSSDSEDGPLLYYRGIYDYLAAKAKGLSDEKIKPDLIATYGDSTATRVIEDFANPEKIFELSTWPSCFDCAACDIRNSCLYFNLLRKVKAFQKRQSANMPDQHTVASLFR